MSILKEIEKAILASDIGITPNNDGKVTVTDATCIIDYLLEIDESAFTESQADMNKDQRITITDVVEVIHAILQQ